MQSNKLMIGCGIAIIVALVIAIVFTLLHAIRIPDAAIQMQAKAAPIFIAINMPMDNSQVVVNQGVSVYVEAFAKSPIKEIELFVDGNPIHNRLGENPPETTKPRVIWWGWVPSEEGLYQLVARARTDNGQAVFSNIVNIKAIPQSDLQPPEPQVLSESKTLTEDEALALVDLDKIEQLAENSPENSFPSSIKPEDPVPPAPPFEETPGDPPAPEIIPIKYILWGQQLAEKLVPISMPAAPEIQGSIKDCKAVLNIRDTADNETGFFIYRLDPGSNLFTHIATLKDSGGKGQVFSYTDANPPVGESTYYASSFNGAGEIQGNVINLKVTNPPCSPATTPTIVVQKAILKTNLTVDKIYGYLSIDKKTWFRFPTAIDEYIYPINNQFDLAKYLPGFDAASPGIHVIDLEIWGWAGETLKSLGKATWEVSSGSIQIVGDNFSINAEVGTSLEVSDTNFQIKAKHIPAPDKLRYMNKDECLQIAGESDKNICDLMEHGYSGITWRWLPNETDELTDIDGFTLYRVQPGGEPEKVGSISASSRVTITVPPSANPDEIAPQMFLRAFKGNIESEDSNKLNGKTGNSIVLKNYITAYGRADHFHLPKILGWKEITSYMVSPWSSGPQMIGSGTLRNSIDLPGEDKYVSFYFDHFVIFDLSPIKGNVLSAKLRWNKGILNTLNYPDNFLYWKCQVVITDGFQDTVIAGAPLKEGMEYDVTWMVRSWMMGLPNDWGFGFQTQDNSLSFKQSYGVELCIYNLDDLSLEVVTDEQ